MSPNLKKKGRGGRKKGGTNQWGPPDKKVIEADLREGKLTLAMINDTRQCENNPMWQYRRSNYARFGDGTHYGNDSSQATFVRNVRRVAKAFVEGNAVPPVQAVVADNHQVSPMTQASAATRHSTATVSVPYNVQSPPGAWCYDDPVDNTSSRDTPSTRFTHGTGTRSRAPPSTRFNDELMADLGSDYSLISDLALAQQEEFYEIRLETNTRLRSARVQEEAKFLDSNQETDQNISALVQAEMMQSKAALNQSEANLRAQEARKLAEDNRQTELAGRNETRAIVTSQARRNYQRYEENLASRMDMIKSAGRLKEIRYLQSCKKPSRYVLYLNRFCCLLFLSFPLTMICFLFSLTNDTLALDNGNNGSHQEVAQNLFPSNGSPETQQLDNVEDV